MQRAGVFALLFAASFAFLVAWWVSNPLMGHVASRQIRCRALPS